MSLFYPDGSEADSRPVTSRLYRPESSDDVKNGDDGGADINKVVRERNELRERMVDIEKKLIESEQFCSSFVVKQERDATEIAKLRLLVDTQNNDIANLETALNDTQNELDKACAAQGLCYWSCGDIACDNKDNRLLVSCMVRPNSILITNDINLQLKSTICDVLCFSSEACM